MLMVIVGAGASFDSIPSRLPRRSDFEAYRPPLADELFQARPLFEGVQRAVPQVMQVAPSLLFRSNGESVEDVLARYAAEADGYPEGETQLAAVRFYLQGIITQCEDGWYRAEKQTPTNLMGLVNHIERKRRGRERPIFVTFNYDRLIENALENRRQNFASMRDYILLDTIRVFKLHGSVDWARRIERLDARRFGGGAWQIARQICDEIHSLPKAGEIERWDGVPSSYVKEHIAIPAITIPVKDKSDFECPPDHVDALKAAIPHVTTMLTIGWRGAELHFLRLLKSAGLRRVDGISWRGSLPMRKRPNTIS